MSDLFDLDSLLKDIKQKTGTETGPSKTLKDFFPTEKIKTSTNKGNPILKNEKPSKYMKKTEESKKQEEETWQKVKASVPSVEEYKKSLNLAGNQHRIQAGCKFCDIIHKQNKQFLYEDDFCVAFWDKAAITAQEHILMCPKTHIRNSHCISKENIPLLVMLEEAGQALLKKRRPDDSYRFGYHEPPMNTIDHLHLHCIVLPIQTPYLNGVIYGEKLASTQKIISKILSGEITPGVFPEKVKKVKGKASDLNIKDFISLDDE